MALASVVLRPGTLRRLQEHNLINQPGFTILNIPERGTMSFEEVPAATKEEQLQFLFTMTDLEPTTVVKEIILDKTLRLYYDNMGQESERYNKNAELVVSQYYPSKVRIHGSAILVATTRISSADAVCFVSLDLEAIRQMFGIAIPTDNGQDPDIKPEPIDYMFDPRHPEFVQGETRLWNCVNLLKQPEFLVLQLPTDPNVLCQPLYVPAQDKATQIQNLLTLLDTRHALEFVVSDRLRMIYAREQNTRPVNLRATSLIQTQTQIDKIVIRGNVLIVATARASTFEATRFRTILFEDRQTLLAQWNIQSVDGLWRRPETTRYKSEAAMFNSSCDDSDYDVSTDSD